MRNEITFLMELFVEDEIPKAIKLKIKDRMSEITEGMTKQIIGPIGHNVLPPGAQFASPRGTTTGYMTIPGPEDDIDRICSNQSPSMQRIMAQNPDIIPKPPQPLTQAAAQALAARQALIHGAANEKPEAGRTSKRKI